MLSVVAVLFIWAPTTSAQTRIVDSAMGPVAVPVAPRRVVVLTNEALEAMIQLGIQPVGSVVAGTDVQWLPHLEPYMDGIVPIGTESQVNLELVAALRPDVIIGVRARHESIYPHLSRIAPTGLPTRLWAPDVKTSLPMPMPSISVTRLRKSSPHGMQRQPISPSV